MAIWNLKWLVAALAAAVAMQAVAVDVVTAALPTPVADARLTIGDRSLVLPGESWSLVARSENHIKMGGVDRRSSYFTVYAMQAVGKELRAGVVLRLPVASTPVNSWRDDPCRMTDAIHRDDFGEIAKTAQCLAVMKRRSHLTGTLNEFYSQAQQWAGAEALKPRGPFYEIYYSRFATNEFGLVRVFVPAAAFSGDDEATAWARQLPAALRPFFEGRQRTAALPAFPTKNP